MSNPFDRERELKHWETVSQEFSLNPIHFLQWYRVLRSIPSSWKKALRSRNVEENMISEDSLLGQHWTQKSECSSTKF